MATGDTVEFDIVASRYSMVEGPHANRWLPKGNLFSDGDHPMRVKLVRKFANVLNGIDLTEVSVGDVLNVRPHQAAMLVAEGWAEEAPQPPGRVLTIQSKKRTASQNQ